MSERTGGDQRFEDFVRRAAGDYNRLPEPPRDLMWARIEGEVAGVLREHREADGEREEGGATGSAEPRRRARFRSALPALRWALAIAASLVMGVAIGRYTAPSSTPEVESRAEATGPGGTAPADSGAERGPGMAYAAAVDHLARSEVFLASFGRDVRAGRVDLAAAERGQDLLSATQILLDSPATHDPKMRALLEDLELVLAQIAHLRRARGGEEAKIASEAIRDRNVLLRLREALPVEPMGN